MNDIPTLVHSPVFWFTVFCSVVIGGLTQNWLGRLSDKGWFIGKRIWSERSQKAHEAWERRIDLMKRSPSFLRAAEQASHSFRDLALFTALFGAILLSILIYFLDRTSVWHTIFSVAIALSFLISLSAFLRGITLWADVDLALEEMTECEKTDLALAKKA